MLWNAELRQTLGALGFTASRLQAGVFHCSEKDIYVVAHVDDLLVAGLDMGLTWLRAALAKKHEMTGKMLSQDSSISFLGREIGMTGEGYIWTGDPKHAKILVSELGLGEAKGVDLPVGVEDIQVHEATDLVPTLSVISDIEVEFDLINTLEGSVSAEAERPLMNKEDARGYRRGAARLNYMAQDRPDVCVSAKLLSRSMANPRVGDEKLLKKVGRYLVRHPVCEIIYGWQEMPSEVTVGTDSDWAGCKRTRRSTSGIALHLGKHLLNFGTRFS